MFDEIGGGVFRRRYDFLDLNVGVVLGEEGALVIDTRASQGQGQELVEEMGGLTDLPVRWVVNTHWHWDHTFGNSRFGGADIWGHELCRIALEELGQEMKRTAIEWMGESLRLDIESTEIVPPSRVFSEAASIDVGREVRLAYHGFGHTDADIVVSIPDAQVTFMGDLVEESAPPSFGDSHPIDWPMTLRLAMSDMEPLVVPGHGDVVDARFVESQQEELAAVADVAQRFVDGLIGLDRATDEGPYPPDVMRTALLRAQATA